MIKNFLCTVLILIASVTTAFASHPLITDDTGTQGKGKYQLEVNSEFTSEKERQYNTDEKKWETKKETGGELATVLSYGITNNVEEVRLMSFAVFFCFPVLNNKINGSSERPKYNYAQHDIKSFHCYSSLSFGVKKYAAAVSIKTVNPIVIAKGRVNFSANILPIIPTVNVYLAASAKILATTFLLSLFTLKVYHKEEAI